MYLMQSSYWRRRQNAPIGARSFAALRMTQRSEHERETGVELDARRGGWTPGSFDSADSAQDDTRSEHERETGVELDARRGGWTPGSFDSADSAQDDTKMRSSYWR